MSIAPRLLLVAGLLVPLAAHGDDAGCVSARCRCLPESPLTTPADRVARYRSFAQAVFVATVQRVDTLDGPLPTPPTRDGTPTDPTHPVVARVLVERAWTPGVRHTAVMHLTNARGLVTSCDMMLDRDATYLIFARRDSATGWYKAHYCSGTRRRVVAESDGTLAALGPALPPAAG